VAAMRTPLKLILLATAIVLVAAATAYAAAATGTFRGSTSQGYHMFVKVQTDGTIQRVNVPFKTTHCNRSDGYSLSARRFLYDAPIKRTGNSFSDQGTSKIPSKGGSATVTAKLKGHISGKRVKGTQDMKITTKDQFGAHKCTSHATFSAKAG
jgi:hypothetical protein